MKTIYKYGLLKQGKYSVNCVVRRVLKNKQNKLYSYSLHTNIYAYGLSLRANPGGSKKVHLEDTWLSWILKYVQTDFFVIFSKF